jgi:choline-sulfatase
LASVLFVSACGGRATPDSRTAPAASVPPSILLVTLDTTRADSIGPDAVGVRTPAFDAIASRGRRFRQAYATVPETLPSHASMMTGLYPAGHAIHENARFLAEQYPVLAERLRQTGYRTAAFVSSFVLARRFGLARGFDVYDDEMPAGRSERPARVTTDQALRWLPSESRQPVLVWVHYFDPHYPYEPPEPFRSQYTKQPYLGEIAAMDQQLGRLIQAFEQHVPGPVAVVIAGDHGEGLGDHGESRHGTLLYQSTMHVPLVVMGPGIPPGLVEAPVSIRRIFHTVLDLAGIASADSLRGSAKEVVLGEAMKPFLEYGWQPQTMVVEGRQKAILAGRLEVYDVVADPSETHDAGSGASVPLAARRALDDYPVPSPDAARPPDTLTEDARRRLASLGYVSAGAAPAVRKDAPRPADMVRLLDVMERASGLFVGEQYAEAIPLLERILGEDPNNLDAALRLATAHSVLGHQVKAVEAFRKAAGIAPGSPSTMRGAASGNGLCPCSNEPCPRRPSGFRRSRPLRRSGSERVVLRMRPPCARRCMRCDRLYQRNWWRWASLRCERRTQPWRLIHLRARGDPSVTPLPTTSNSESCTWRPGDLVKRAPRSIECRRPIRHTRWCCSSGRR